jgi:hypothetical protein
MKAFSKGVLDVSRRPFEHDRIAQSEPAISGELLSVDAKVISGVTLGISID